VPMLPRSKRQRLDLLARLSSAALVLLAGAASCTQLAQVDVTGEWLGTILWTSGPMTSFQSLFSLDLVDDEGTVSGTATVSGSGMSQFEMPILFGEVHADTVAIQAEGLDPMTSPPTPVRYAFDGEATTTTMSGVGSLTVRGAVYTFTWQATRTAPPAVP